MVFGFADYAAAALSVTWSNAASHYVRAFYRLREAQWRECSTLSLDSGPTIIGWFTTGRDGGVAGFGSVTPVGLPAGLVRWRNSHCALVLSVEAK